MLASRRDLGLLLASSALVSLLPRLAGATTMVALDLPTLAKTARGVVLGTAQQGESSWRTVGGAERIVTHTEVLLHDIWLDDELLPFEQVVVVRTLGGRVGKLQQKVTGEAAPTNGKMGLFFLGAPSAATNARAVTGMGQGHFPVQSRDGRLVLERSPRMPSLVRPSGMKRLSAVDELHGQDLEAAQKLVRSAR